MREDDIGDLQPVAPLFVEVSELPGRGDRTARGTADLWGCRAHPEWSGSDIELSDVAYWEQRGWFAEEPGGPRGVYDAEAVEVHAALHGIRVERRPKAKEPR
jgi:hypothetical protein